MKNRAKIPYLLDTEKTPIVEQLLEIMRDDRSYIKELPAKLKIAPNHKKKKKINVNK